MSADPLKIVLVEITGLLPVQRAIDRHRRAGAWAAGASVRHALAGQPCCERHYRPGAQGDQKRERKEAVSSIPPSESLPATVPRLRWTACSYGVRR
jgi:hypothetical protein